METRKIQTVGGGTYTVSVPKEWAQRQDLETGETVRLYTHRDGSLILRGSRTDGKRLRSVSLPGVDRSVATLERSIQAAYEAGFERITLVADDGFSDEQRRTARTLARRLIGTEVVGADRSEITVGVLLDASAVSIRQSIDQAASIVTSMQRTAVDGATGDGDVAPSVRDRRPEVDRPVALIRRHYNRSLVSFAELDVLGIDRVPLSRYHRTADRLDRIASRTVRLAEAIDDVPPDIDQGRVIAERTRTLRSALEDATKRVLEGTGGSGTETERMAVPDRTPVRELPPDEASADPAVVRVLDCLRGIDDHVRTIERIAMQSTVQARRP